MAVAFKVEHSRTSEYRFLPEKISIKSELNGRHDLPDIEWLKKDILERGQVQPVTIRKDGDKAVLVAGFSRWRAVSELNKGRKDADKIHLRCTYVLCTEAEAFMANIAENRFRNSTTELDDAHNIKRLMNNYSMTEEQVAAVYFPGEQEKKESLKWVRGRLKLVALTPEAEKALKDGRMKLPAAKAIAKLSEDQQRDAVKGSAKVKASAIREASGKPKPVSLKTRLKSVIDQGWFPGPSGKQVEASIELLDWLGRLVN
jgi:ParB/RepB/Spo0J family partition protein